MTFKRFLYYQTTIIMAGSIIFPFYVLLLNNVGKNYAQFGWAYGLFALTSALFYPLIGKEADRLGDKKLFIIYSWGMAIILLFFPLVTEVWHVYILQILMGLLGAIQRNTEKTALARQVTVKTAGTEIGKYHIITSIGAAVAIIITGYMVDFLTIGSIFYVASLMYVVSAIMLMRN